MNEVLKSLKEFPKHLMTGVSYMIPVVVAGGMLFAFGVILSGHAATPTEGFPGGLATIGIAGLTLFIPIMGGYIAYSMADRPGIAPGIIAAYLANSIGAGFIGAMIGGVLAGCVVILLKQIKVKQEIASIMPIFVIPILGSFVAGGLIYWVIGTPIASLMTSLSNFLKGMSGGSKFLFGIINGMMYAFDMGGAMNKTAYTFSMGMMNEGIYWPQGINTVACATPPLGMALAVLLNKKKYTQKEQTMGISSLLMGCVGITEGAIPFAVKDPLRVIPSVMFGSAVGGGLAAALGLESTIAWDSFVALPGINKPLIFLLCLAIGCVVTAVTVNLLKKDVVEDVEAE
jgi:fructose-specific PTS system IIC-like component